MASESKLTIHFWLGKKHRMSGKIPNFKVQWTCERVQHANLQFAISFMKEKLKINFIKTDFNDLTHLTWYVHSKQLVENVHYLSILLNIGDICNSQWGKTRNSLLNHCLKIVEILSYTFLIKFRESSGFLKEVNFTKLFG